MCMCAIVGVQVFTRYHVLLQTCRNALYACARHVKQMVTRLTQPYTRSMSRHGMMLAMESHSPVVIEQQEKGGTYCTFYTLASCTWVSPLVDLDNGDEYTGPKWYLPLGVGHDECAPCPDGMTCDGLNFKIAASTAVVTTTTTTTVTKGTITYTRAAHQPIADPSPNLTQTNSNNLLAP